MNMATIDPRPSYFGDRMIVTGSYDAGETGIDLSSLLASIDFCGINTDVDAIATTPPVSTGDTATISGTTVTINAAGAATLGGTFLAIGRRN